MSDCHDINAGLAGIKAMKEPIRHAGCLWMLDEDHVYQTECGHAFFFDSGNIFDNGFEWCPYCSGTIWEEKSLELE